MSSRWFNQAVLLSIRRRHFYLLLSFERIVKHTGNEAISPRVPLLVSLGGITFVRRRGVSGRDFYQFRASEFLTVVLSFATLMGILSPAEMPPNFNLTTSRSCDAHPSLSGALSFRHLIEVSDILRVSWEKRRSDDDTAHSLIYIHFDKSAICEEG